MFVKSVMLVRKSPQARWSRSTAMFVRDTRQVLDMLLNSQDLANLVDCSSSLSDLVASLIKLTWSARKTSMFLKATR